MILSFGLYYLKLKIVNYQVEQ